MNILLAIAAFLAALLLAAAGATRIGVAVIESRYPPQGAFIDVNGTRIHHVAVDGPEGALPVVFIHGASGNLLDQKIPLEPLLAGRHPLLFFDRPGHGWSDPLPSGNGKVDSQADLLADMLDALGHDRAIIVAHSFGGAVGASFALRHPEKTAGIVFLAAATHPWPGGGTSWYYELTAVPVIGRIFSETLALPAGWSRVPAATDCVFAPNRAPDTYAVDAAIPLVLRPSAFRANARDVESLYAHAVKTAPLYPQISAPAIVISGDSDTVVYEEIHSVGLARDIPGARAVWVPNLGHKPDYAAADLVVAAIENLSGENNDLDAVARSVADRIAGDRFGPIERCKDEKAPVSARP